MFGRTPRADLTGYRSQQQGQVISRPAPVGGWNARDPVAEMPPTDAVKLVNWFPILGSCVMRAGSTNWVTGFASQVETVIGYQGAAGKLFAASGGKIYDVTTTGALGAASVSGLTNNRWQGLNFTTTGGTRYLLLFNGADNPQYFDGTTWTAITGVSTPAITGLTTSQIITATEHKSRLWLVRTNTLELYYLPVGAVGGAASLFDLRPIFKRGGKIVALETWSVDAGRGLDDHLVVATDQGEIAVYSGTDPTSASTWALVGVYYVGGSIIGNRPFVRYGGDLLVVCQLGVLPVSKMLQSTTINITATLSEKIQAAISEVITAYASSFGWQLVYYASPSLLFLNVPTANATVFEQYAMNVITGAWCRFTGMNALCWEIFGDRIFFGGQTAVVQGWTGLDDNGVEIMTDLKTAFDYLGMSGVLKQWLMCRPVLAADGTPGATYGLNVDFDDADVAGVPSFIPPAGSTWDAALWDSGVWAGGGALQINKNWQFLAGLGYAGAFRLKTASKGLNLQLQAIDYLAQAGGVL
jgi:hypothetical protein